MNTTKSWAVLKLLVTGILILVSLIAVSSSCKSNLIITPTSTTDTTATAVATNIPKPSGLPPGPVEDTFDIETRNSDFSIHNLTVSAGAKVTITFHNEDNGIQHNLSVYTTQDATTPVFLGAIVTGPNTAIDTFTAPTTPGTYYFRCDIHPEETSGTFVVQ